MKLPANPCTRIRMMNPMILIQKGKSKYPYFEKKLDILLKIFCLKKQKMIIKIMIFLHQIYLSRDSRHESEAQSVVDVSAIKGIMSGLKLPDSAIPSWGVHLSDKDFIAVIKDTIKDKKSRVEAAESSKSDEKIDQSNN